MGGEYFLASVGGCFMSTLLAAVRARDLKLTDIRTEVIGTLAETPSRFTALELHVSTAGGDLDQLEKLSQIADRGCIMMNTLRGHLELRIEIVVRA